MEDEVKNVCDLLIDVLTLIGAGVAFYFSLHQWKCGQALQKAGKLDEFIAKFESDELLRLAATILDWRERKITCRNREVRVCSREVLLALRIHTEIKESPQFPGDQMMFRDAYDALLNFLQRLEIAIAGNLVDPIHARKCFGYWIERLLKFERHKDDPNQPFLDGRKPGKMVRDYVRAYGDPESFRRLCEEFGMDCEEIEGKAVPAPANR
jgi:hypothetical protein